MSRGRFAASAEGHKAGITLLVPRPVVDAEQDQLMGFLTSAKVQNLIVFLRRGGLRHLDVDERIRKGDYKGYCPLHVAVLCGTSSVVSALIELSKASADVKSARPAPVDEVPLHLAARKGDVGMVRALIQAGAAVDARDGSRLTPLLVAASALAGQETAKGSFHHLVAAELIEQGASLVARDERGDTPLHLACDSPNALPLVHKIIQAATAKTEKVGAGLAEAVEALNVAGEGVLHRAIAKKHADVAQILLNAGARSDARSSAGDTAMHCAAREGLEPIATMLLESGPGALNASNLAGETPLFLAMSSGTANHARIARQLLASGAFAFGRTRNGETVLHACAREGNTQLAELILARQTGASPVKSGLVSERITRPTHSLDGRKSPERGRAADSQPSRESGGSISDVLNCRALNGGTPLHVAVNNNQMDMVNMILKQEGLDRGQCDGEGNTAVHLAATSGDVVLLQRLLMAGRGVGYRELSVRNALGWAALHTSAFKGQDVAVRLLLRFQAPVELRTADGWTALHLACSEGHRSVVTSLLAAGAQLDAQHPSGESALGLAASRGHHKVIQELLNMGASPSAQADDYGWTPMHAALAHGDGDVALALLQKGGRIRSRPDETAPPVGEPIDLADARLRGVLLEADEQRRRKNRLSGRDSDDGGDEGPGEWEYAISDEPPPKHWPHPKPKQVSLLLPDTNAATHLAPNNDPALSYSALNPVRGERPGRFGYYGDPGIALQRGPK